MSNVLAISRSDTCNFPSVFEDHQDSDVTESGSKVAEKKNCPKEGSSFILKNKDPVYNEDMIF